SSASMHGSRHCRRSPWRRSAAPPWAAGSSWRSPAICALRRARPSPAFRRAGSGWYPAGAGTRGPPRCAVPRAAAPPILVPGWWAGLILGAEVVDGATARELGIVQWAVPRAELAQRALEIARHVAALPAAALAASKACIAAAGEAGRGGYSDELEATRRLLTA